MIQTKPSHPTFTCPSFNSRVVPVIVITDVSQAVPLAFALLEGGIDVMEITLRNSFGLLAIEAVARQVPQMHVGAGTVTRAEDMLRVKAAGARFALSPGLTQAIVHAAMQCEIPFIPGVMSPSEVMNAQDLGFTLVKFFPAVQSGGLNMLKAFSGPLEDMRFCPTGGITENNMLDFLRLPNVSMVGGSWITPLNLMENGHWKEITRLARQVTEATGTS